MKKLQWILGLPLFLSTAFAEEPVKEGSARYTIAFGSCSREQQEIPILSDIAERKPDCFIFLGDNIYGDTRDMAVLQKKYEKLGSKTSYQNLKAASEILATWDDHDFGENDAGKEYPFKEESKQLFLAFLRSLPIQNGFNTREFITRNIGRWERIRFKSFC